MYVLMYLAVNLKLVSQQCATTSMIGCRNGSMILLL